MRYDFSPLYRSTVGFDRVFDMLDQATRVEPMANWPPYNIEKLGEDQYRITMAVAGFAPEEIQLVQQETTLLVTGQKHPEPEGVEVLHRGIATRAFKQSFDLADHVKVVAANLDNGLLTIELKREIPEALKPRRIEIASSGGPKPVGQENVHRSTRPRQRKPQGRGLATRGLCRPRESEMLVNRRGGRNDGCKRSDPVGPQPQLGPEHDV